VALRGAPGVSPSVRERIVAIADQMGYRPQAAGRALVTGRQHKVGFACERGYEAGRDWLIEIQNGVIEVLEARGYHAVVFHAEPSESVMPTALLERVVDGMVLGTFWSPAFLDELSLRGVPVVAANPGGEINCDSVGIDETAAAHAVTRHLLELGHRRIAFVGTNVPVAAHFVNLRWEGYLAAVSEAGLPVSCGGDRFTEQSVALSRLYDQEDPPTALVCFSDMVAARVIRDLRARGIESPRDVSIVSFDNTCYAMLLWPALTTIAQPFREMGRRAVEMLFERLENPDLPARHETLPFEMIVRESTATPLHV